MGRKRKSNKAGSNNKNAEPTIRNKPLHVPMTFEEAVEKLVNGKPQRGEPKEPRRKG